MAGGQREVRPASRPPDERESVGAHRARAGPRVGARRPVEVEKRAERTDDGVDATTVEARWVAGELHGAAEADASTDRCRHGVDLLEDHGAGERARAGERHVVALPRHHGHPQVEEAGEALAAGAGGEHDLVGVESAARGGDRAHPVVDTIDTEHAMVLEHPHPAAPEHRDEIVDEPAGVYRSVAGQQEAGAHVTGEGRYQRAQLPAVHQRRRRRCTERDHRREVVEQRLGEGDVVERHGHRVAALHGDAGGDESVDQRRGPRVEADEGGAGGGEPALRARSRELHHPRGEAGELVRADAHRAGRVGHRAEGRPEHARARQRADERRTEEAGVAARRSAAERGDVDHGDLGAPFGEREGGVQADKSAAEDEYRGPRHGAHPRAGLSRVPQTADT